MLRKPSVHVSVHSYGRSLQKGIRLIDKFKTINGYGFKLDVKLDFQDKDLGYYFYDTKDKSLYINPLRCSDKNRYGLPTDNSICATLIHEFSHYLDDKFSILPEYRVESFALKSLVMTRYAKNNLKEEMADLISLYIINPYFIYLVDKERHTWLKSKFKSPTPCGVKTFVKYWYMWSPKQRRKVQSKYGITVKGDGVVKK